jgi:hypothetical protein
MPRRRRRTSDSWLLAGFVVAFLAGLVPGAGGDRRGSPEPAAVTEVAEPQRV